MVNKNNLQRLTDIGSATYAATLAEIKDVATIDQYLYTILEHYKTIYATAGNMQKRYEENILRLIEKASTEGVDKLLLSEYSHFGKDDKIFPALVSKASGKKIDDLLFNNNQRISKTFHNLVRTKRGAVFKKMIDKVSPEILNQNLVKQDSDGNGKTVLCIILENQDEVGVKSVMDKASPAAVDAALTIEDSNGNSAFSQAVLMTGNKLRILSEKASTSAINKGLVSTHKTRRATGYCAAVLNQDIDMFVALTKQLPVPYICTSFLRIQPGFKTYKDFVQNIKNKRADNFNVVNEKVPAFLEILSDFDLVATNPEKYGNLHHLIFDEFDAKNMTINDLHLWINFLSKVLNNAPNEELKNQIRVTYAQINLMAAEKVRNTPASGRRKSYENEAFIHVNAITSPEGLSVKDNFFIFEAYRSQNMPMNARILSFLHQAVVDVAKMESKHESDIYDMSLPAQLLARVVVILDPNSDIQIDFDKQDWTDEDEENYQRAALKIESKEYKEYILAQELKESLEAKKQLEAEEYLKQIELKIKSLDEDMKLFNEDTRHKGRSSISILNDALTEIKQQVVVAKNAEDIVAASEMLQRNLSENIQLIEKRICWLKAIEYFKGIEGAIVSFEENRYKNNIHEKNNPSPFVIRVLNGNIADARNKMEEYKTAAEIIQCVEKFKETMLPTVLQELEKESDREIGRILRKIAAAIKNIPFVGVKISSYIKHQKRKQGLFRSSVGQLKNIRDNLKESPFELKSGKK